MGREIRRVPPNWEHPRRECPHSPWAGGCSEAKAHGGMCYQPMYDESFESAAKDWKERLAAWERGERPSYCDESKPNEFWECEGGPPEREMYHPNWSDEEATWYQVYQTVSEGSPVSPPFATPEELAKYLSDNGDFWHQGRVKEGHADPSDKPTYDQALAFVTSGFAVSLMVKHSAAGVEAIRPYQQATQA